MQQGTPSALIDGSLIDYDGICQNVRAALDAVRIHAVSLLDEHGEVLWLTESAMGPDEHNAVREAIETFSAPTASPILAFDLGAARSAVMFRAVNSRRTFVGAVMVIMDTRGVPLDPQGLARMMTPKLQQALARFTAIRPQTAPDPQAPPARQAALAPAATPAKHTPFELTLADSMRVRQPSPPAAVAKPPPQPVPPDIDRLNAALRRSPLALYVQRLMPLSQGGDMKRYEVLLRSQHVGAGNAAPHAMLKTAVEYGLGSMIDRRVFAQLIGWLVQTPDIWRTTAVMFSVNLTKTALHDTHFIRFVELCLAKSALPKTMIAFEIDVPTAVTLGDRIDEVAMALHRLGCPLVLDDFGLRTECFDLLRLPSVRYIKIDAQITSKMRTDKLSQAAITAMVQMARVLGMHTVAKRTETSEEQEWLTALGVDFIQSNSMSPPVAIETLSASAKPSVA